MNLDQITNCSRYNADIDDITLLLAIHDFVSDETNSVAKRACTLRFMYDKIFNEGRRQELTDDELIHEYQNEGFPTEE